MYETALAAMDPSHWHELGFLYGPWRPIYGVGAVLAIVVLYRRVKNIPHLFLIGVALATIVEYITALVLEHIFHRRWWDYSHYYFQIEGRVSLLGAIAFGILAVLLIRVVHPRIDSLTERISDKTKIILASVLFGLFALDFCITVIHLLGP